VRNIPSRLFQQQAFLRFRPIDPSTRVLFKQTIVVTLGIVPKKRQPKAILSAAGTVTIAGVTAGLHEDGHYVVFKADFICGLAQRREGEQGEEESGERGWVFHDYFLGSIHL
jgi:hypothetical protein